MPASDNRQFSSQYDRRQLIRLATDPNIQAQMLTFRLVYKVFAQNFG